MAQILDLLFKKIMDVPFIPRYMVKYFISHTGILRGFSFCHEVPKSLETVMEFVFKVHEKS